MEDKLVMYKVRVLSYYGSKLVEDDTLCKDYSEALDKFIFYVRAACELHMSIRCVNILKGNKSIKMFQNH